MRRPRALGVLKCPKVTRLLSVHTWQIDSRWSKPPSPPLEQLVSASRQIPSPHKAGGDLGSGTHDAIHTYWQFTVPWVHTVLFLMSFNRHNHQVKIPLWTPLLMRKLRPKRGWVICPSHLDGKRWAQFTNTVSLILESPRLTSAHPAHPSYWGRGPVLVSGCAPVLSLGPT